MIHCTMLFICNYLPKHILLKLYFGIEYIQQKLYICLYIHLPAYVADIRGGRDKDDNSSVRLDNLLTQRHTPHPHCPPSVGGNIFPQSMHLSHISYIYLYTFKQPIQFSSISPDSVLGLRTPVRVAESGVSVLTSFNHINY